MSIEHVHTLILGTGPAGLAAGYTLAKAGVKPVLLERDKVFGGLMRSIRRGDFVVDVGRKELYNRLEQVDHLWSEVLGENYRNYAHRGGILYDKHIIEMSPAYRGFRRGMPWSLFLECAFGLLAAQIKPGAPTRNVEEYFYRKRGRSLTQVLAQGFQEKLTGKQWKDIPLSGNDVSSNGHNAGAWETLKQAVIRSVSTKEVNTYKGIWRHPAKGTGQICDALADGILRHGGRIEYQANILAMSAGNGRIEAVTADLPSGRVTYSPKHIVSSIPLDLLLRFLSSDSGSSEPPPAIEPVRRTVVLVYLFLDENPRFPQAWLQVTCPKTRIGRITNYSGFNGDMVPEGKTCLCCEYYCFGADSLLDLDPAQLARNTLEDCARYNLVDASKCFDHLVLKFPGADASQNRHNWLSTARMQAVAGLKELENLYYVSRTDLDIATLAGMEAGEAIVSGDRTTFDFHIDPKHLPIRSVPKPFEFKLPVTN